MAKSDFSKLLNVVDKMTHTFQPDTTFWKPDPDKTGNYQAIIRPLPEREGSVPFVRLYNHGFKLPNGKWFIENCPTTLGNDCPCCLSNTELWNEGTEAAKKVVRDRKRKVNYIINILVIKDPKHPENEGKVFKFKFGKKIFDMFVEKIKPSFEGEEPLNPFDPEEGANFNLRVRKVEGWPNYDKSTFSSACPIDGDINEIMKQAHDLEAEIALDQFKSYDDLLKKFNSVVGNSKPIQESYDEEDFETESTLFKTSQKEETEELIKTKKLQKPMPKTDEDDDDVSYFDRLANE